MFNGLCQPFSVAQVVSRLSPKVCDLYCRSLTPATLILDDVVRWMRPDYAILLDVRPLWGAFGVAFGAVDVL